MLYFKSFKLIFIFTRYGLIIPTKSNPTGTIAKPQKSIKLAAFDDDDELDEGI